MVQHDRLIRRTAAAVAAALSVAAVAACGNDSSSSSSSASGGASTTSQASSSPAVASAQKLTAQYSAEQPPLKLAPLPAKPDPGVNVAVLTCGFPSCQATTKGVQEGAKALGWNAKVYTSEITPEGYKATWDQMLQDKPDAIVYTGLMPNATIKPQLAKVAQMKIPTVGIAGWDPPGGVLKALYSGQTTLAQSGKLMGAAVVADAKGPAKTVFVWDPRTLMKPVYDAFSGEVKGAGGSVDQLPIALQDTGKAVPGQVVSYLQAHPDVKYVAFGISDFGAGVPQAMKSAGITGVKIVDRAAHPNNVADVQDGMGWTTVAEETDASGLRAIDALARIRAGVPYDKAPPGWARILNKSNTSEGAAVLATPGSPQAFLQAWHAG